MARDEIGYFHWADYLVLIFSLVVTIAIGIFYAVRDRKKQNNEDFLMAGRNMTIAPVTASTFATLVSCMGFISYPLEVYYFGVSFVFLGVGACLGVIPIAHLIAPSFHRAQIVSAFEYLETSYNASVRKAAAIIQIVLLFFYLGMLAYTPALALAQVSGVSRVVGILLTTIVGTFYTAFGGMKAVVWSNVAQVALMYAGILILAFKAIADLGGFREAIIIMEAGGRLSHFSFNPDPFLRSTVWTYLFGSFAQAYIQLSSTQMAIQRYGTLPKVRDVQISLYLFIPMYMMLAFVVVLTGLALYGHFATCDPVLNGDVEAIDQLIPLLVMKVLGPWPGMPGLFMACIYAASLSTLSAGMNGIAAVVLEDLIQPMYLKIKKKPMTEKRAFFVAKFAVMFVGALVTGMAFVILAMKGDLFSLLMMFMGVFAGPIAALFTMAILFPKLKDIQCVITGFCIAVIIGVIISVGCLVYRTPPNMLPISTAGCHLIENGTVWNSTEHMTPVSISALAHETTVSPPPAVKPTGLAKLFSLSPMYYAVVGFLAAVGVALIMDAIKKCCARRQEEKNKDNREKIVEGIKYSEVMKHEPPSWEKKHPKPLPDLHSELKMTDSITQTVQSIPPGAHQDILWVYSDESTT